MITITEAAEEKIANLVAASDKPVKGLRIGARLDPAKQVDYKLAFISPISRWAATIRSSTLRDLTCT